MRGTCEPAWWQSGIIYQIYPRSFQDSNNDGIGDLPGIIARLDYLVWLGIDALWLSPVYPSPMADFGYDVSNYVDIDPIFGSLDDFAKLIAEAHHRGLKIIMDFVPNHTSEAHPWFADSRSARTSAKRDWYIWRDAAPDGGPPNNWLSEFGGPAWTWDEATGQYYYHAYLPQQPDLNWRNPDVHTAMREVLHFWFKRGVDGFRIDTVHHLYEVTSLADNPTNPDFKPGMAPTLALDRRNQYDQPELHETLADFRHIADSYGPRVLIGEIYLPLERIVTYYGVDLKGVHLPFNFHLIGATWRAKAVADLITRYEALLPPGAWPNWVLGNHDRARIASRVGPAAARSATMLLLTLRGTPTLYYGDEIGMTDGVIPAEKVQDPWELRVPGFGFGRDPVRTPMAWTSEPNGGFSAGEPWLPLHDTRVLNVADQQADMDSMLSLTRALIILRREEPALHRGDYGLIEARGDVLVYERRHGTRAFVILLNFAAVPVYTPLDGAGALLLSTHPGEFHERVGALVRLRPHEGIIVELSREP
ncbi:MAG: alpha-amylase family glycosyl hydrolase [Rhodospirillaceae bacterium]